MRNPALRAMSETLRDGRAGASDTPLTIDAVVARTGAALSIVVAAGVLAAWLNSIALVLPAALVGLALALVTISKRSSNPALILSYAACEGLVLGAITGGLAVADNTIALQAVVGTLGVFVAMLLLHRTHLIPVTRPFVRGLTAALSGAALLMIVDLVASGLFGFDTGLRGASWVGVGFSILCVVLAALSLVVDFAQIGEAIENGAPERTAWYFAFSLTVTLVWLYLEILRLLSRRE